MVVNGKDISKPKGAIHKSTKIRETLKGVMRNDILKFMMQLPLRDFAVKNPQVKDFVETQFGKYADELTVEMAMVFQNIANNIMNPNAKDFSYIQAELYGKVKEEAVAQIIELPPMQDASDIINSLDTQTLERILTERKLLEAPKETFKQQVDEFQLISI